MARAGTRILLAEDSAERTGRLGPISSPDGVHVSETGDGKATIEHLQSHEVDGLLLDLNMPVASMGLTCWVISRSTAGDCR